MSKLGECRFAECRNAKCRYEDTVTVKHVRVLIGLTTGACIIKLIAAVIYGFRNKLECLSVNTRLNS